MATHSRSRLENPRDRGAWWAAVYAVTQSRTRLKRLSRSSSKFFFSCGWNLTCGQNLNLWQKAGSGELSFLSRLTRYFISKITFYLL